MKVNAAFFFTVLLMGGLALSKMPRPTQAEEVTPKLAAADKQRAPNLETKGSAESGEAKTPELLLRNSVLVLSTNASSHLLQESAKSGDLKGPAHRKGQAVSAEFPVSPDPRDKVWLTVSNRVITLRGSVNNRELAQKLVNRLARVDDVREVRNRLTIRTKNKDLEIATQLRDVLSRDPTTDAWAIAVSVIRGVVFLSGTVSSEEERKRANDLALNVTGVKQVNNGLQVPSVNRFLRRAPTPRTITAPRNYNRAR